MQVTRRLAHTFCALAAASLAACGGGDDSPPDPLQPYRAQALQWAVCDATILGAPDPDIDTLLPTGRLQCAQVRAPLDWQNPGRGGVSIAVMRLAAAQPAKRRGALFFNPGGPGIDGLSSVLRLWGAFSGSLPESPQGARQLRLLDEYDMVGFSPRGTGASTRLECATNELERPVDHSAAGWQTPANLVNVHYNGSKTAQACAKNPLATYINTDATARDLDLLRGLLGDDKLNYVGYSYGTWLGAWYASLFPEKVGRMVLDSALDFGTTIEKSLLQSQPPARQRLFDAVLAPYAARHAGYFHLGATAAEVSAIPPSLSPRMQAVLAETLSGLGYSRWQADGYLEQISAAQGLNAVLKSVPAPSDRAAVEGELARHVFDPAIAARNAYLRQAALKLYNRYEKTWLTPVQKPIALNPGAATSLAVRCNDTPSITDWAEWTASVHDISLQAPLYFGGLLQFSTCTFWGGPSVSKPDPAAMQALPVLFVQSQYDSATNTDGANTFFAQLPGARRVYVPGDFQHGVYPYNDTCVDPLVTDYLLDESPTQRETVCPSHPLEQDAPTPAAQEKSTALPPVYKNPQRTLELIDRFKRSLVMESRSTP